MENLVTFKITPHWFTTLPPFSPPLSKCLPDLQEDFQDFTLLASLNPRFQCGSVLQASL